MKSKQKQILLVLVIFGAIGFLLLAPNGAFQATEQSVAGGSQVLHDPDFAGDAWSFGAWRSAGGSAEAAWHSKTEGKVSMGVSGYDTSFYAVSLDQGAGPTLFNWGSRTLYVPINGSFHNIVSWCGSMDYVNVSAIGCLGMGVDFWFDAVFPDGGNKPVELYVFFYMAGAYAIPVGSLKSLVRQDYNYSSRIMGLEWNYAYFHHSQDRLGASEHRFDLGDYVSAFKRHLPEYKQADFFLTRVDACLELFQASGKFSVSYLGLEQSAR